MAFNPDSFRNTDPYPKKPSRPAQPAYNADSGLIKAYLAAVEQYEDEMVEYEKEIKKYNDKTGELYAMFKKAALKEVGLEGHEAAERAYSYAWDAGHAHGYNEVFTHLKEIAYVITGEYH